MRDDEIGRLRLNRVSLLYGGPTFCPCESISILLARLYIKPLLLRLTVLAQYTPDDSGHSEPVSRFDDESTDTKILGLFLQGVVAVASAENNGNIGSYALEFPGQSYTAHIRHSLVCDY